MMSNSCVIVGASHAGTQVATRLRRYGWDSDIHLVGEEPHLPYHRPPLSKDYLKGIKPKNGIPLHSEAAYDRANVQLMLGKRVVDLDRHRKNVTLDAGETLAYTNLILALGARPRELSVPGAEVSGTYYLRDTDDVDRIRSAVTGGGKAVVIGGGYIGLETTASLRMLGMEVTVIEAIDRVLQRVTCAPVSSFFRRVHTEEGVVILESSQVTRILGETHVVAVELSNGEIVDADLVIIGVGVLPNVELAKSAGLAVSNGIDVDSQARTSDPHVYAVGDCACFVHPVYARRIRLESVQNANDQAVIAARTICGESVAYDSVPWFWSDQFDVKLQIAGLAPRECEILVRGDPAQDRRASVLYVEDGTLRSIDAINNARDFVAAKKLILSELQLDSKKALNPDVPLISATL